MRRLTLILKRFSLEMVLSDVLSGVSAKENRRRQSRGIVAEVRRRSWLRWVRQAGSDHVIAAVAVTSLFLSACDDAGGTNSSDTSSADGVFDAGAETTAAPDGDEGDAGDARADDTRMGDTPGDTGIVSDVPDLIGVGDLVDASDLADVGADASDSPDGDDVIDVSDMSDMSIVSCGDGVVDPISELCDPAIPSGDPGSCPTSATCLPQDSCESATLAGAGCQTECVTETVTVCANADGCCPSGCNANLDDDCMPVCNNGARESGELCDTAIPSGMPGACPTSCTAPSVCETSMLTGTGCQTECVDTPIQVCSSGDGCCPNGCTSGTDTDCSAQCGNGFRDPMEACDTAIAANMPDACPDAASCQPSDSCESAQIVGQSCDAVCVRTTETLCVNDDGCCPTGCTAVDDNDCMPECGNGVVESPTELCDTSIMSGMGVCPDAGTCMPTATCETAVLMGAMCTAECVRGSISVCAHNDGCCPMGAGCDNTIDDDCEAECGNDVVEMGEDCDEISAQCDPLTCTWVVSASGVLINEFRVAPTSEEFIELINGTSTIVSLSGWEIHHTDSGGTDVYPIVDGVTIPANGLRLITTAELTQPGGSLYTASGALLELVAPDNSVVDSVGYGLLGDAPAPIFSHSTGRVNDGVDTDDDALDFNMDPFPTIGMPNDVTAVDLGNTAVVINEFFVQTAFSTTDFVELYNTSSSAVDIGDWIFIFGGDEHIFPAGTTIPGNAYLFIEEPLFPSFSVLSGSGTMYLFKPSWVRVQQVTFGGPADGLVPTDGSSSVGLTPDGDVTQFWGVTHADQGLELLTPSEGMANP